MKKGETAMRKIMLVLAVAMGLTNIVNAGPISVDVGGNIFYLPFQVVNGTQLYSVKDGKGYPGAETVLARRGRYRVTFGAAPVLGTSNNVPFLAVQGRLSPVLFDTSDNDLQFGLWAGKPSQGKEWTWGIKCSAQLW